MRDDSIATHIVSVIINPLEPELTTDDIVGAFPKNLPPVVGEPPMLSSLSNYSARWLVVRSG